MKTALIIFLLVSQTAYSRGEKPYKIVLITDDNSDAKAREFETYLRSQPPFDRIDPADLQIVRQKAPTGSMNCQSPHPETENSRRLVTCDQRALRRVQRQAKGDFAVAITSAPSYYGGSGGQIPVATVESPNHVLLHEMLHTYGLEDEYPYTGDEIARYCKPGHAGPNMAFFKDVPPYASDPAARVTHAGDVPWMGRISADMPITQLPALGSPSRSVTRGTQQIGLYRGGNCPDRPDGKKSWKPYGTSIMNGHEDDFMYPIYADVVSARIRRSIGREPRIVSATARPRGTEVSVEVAPETSTEATPATETSGTKEE